MDCAEVSEQGRGALERLIILTGSDTSSALQATSLAACSLGEQLCVNSQLCVIPYGSNTRFLSNEQRPPSTPAWELRFN